MRFIFSVFCFFSFVFIPAQLYANSFLFFAPTRLDLSDKKPISEIRVSNTSNEIRSYRLKVSNLVMPEKGPTINVDDFEYAAKRMLRFVPRSFDLDPGKTQIIRVMARIPSDTADGEYHSHIEFLENAKRSSELNAKKATQEKEKARMSARFAFSAAIPVTVSKGEISTQLSLSDAVIRPNDKGEKTVFLTIGREGNGQGNAYIDADYITPDGSVIPVGARRTVYIYREINRREYSFTLNLLKQNNIPADAQIRVRLFNRDISADEPAQEVVVPLNG